MSLVRCAIYTRKSSEEGLEQSFNSLDAQREACEAYVRSQQHEGWVITPETFDDGGYSGGNMGRPALQKLLDSVAAGRVDTIVVYKIDRLTRSLFDFAKIVEQLDKKGVSFVSVTQQFNTTTSMGRLTLNVLLSFAQFEREVTGERIRDKIAASKRKGMWMGGVVPMGYDVQERRLVANERTPSSCGRSMRPIWDKDVYRNFRHTSSRKASAAISGPAERGNTTGGQAFSRGALSQMLQNWIYLGEITHKEVSYAAQHQAINPKPLSNSESTAEGQHAAERTRPRTTESAMLLGLLTDSEGNSFSPAHTRKKGHRYRYYLCPTTKQRLSAEQIERLFARKLKPCCIHHSVSWTSSAHQVRRRKSFKGSKNSRKAVKSPLLKSCVE